MIDALMQALFGPLGGILAGIGAAIIAWTLGRHTGRSDALAGKRADDMQDAFNHERLRHEIDRHADGPDARDRLRADWERH
jgi:hypothetical protein